jgi:hypothetical protein
MFEEWYGGAGPDSTHWTNFRWDFFDLLPLLFIFAEFYLSLFGFTYSVFSFHMAIQLIRGFKFDCGLQV